MSEAFATSDDIRDARPDVPIQTIRRHMRQGAPWFPGARLIGRTWTVPVGEAENYVEQYQRYARKEGPDAATSGPVPPEKEA